MNAFVRFFHKLRSLKDDIHISISEELFKKFDVEYKCVYYEHLYGDNDARHVACC